MASRLEESSGRTFVRSANERLEAACVGHRFNGSNPLPFLCECGDPQCTSLITLTLDEYESARAFPARFVVARNHENPEDDRVVCENGRFAIVELVTGELSKLARERNPRWQRGGPW